MIKCIILITGARKDVSRECVDNKLNEYLKKYLANEIILIHGNALGVDSFAKLWTDYHGVHEICVPAKWNKYGKKAGSIRNELMVNITKLFKQFNIEVVVEAFPSEESIGTLDCIKRAKSKLLKIIVNKT